jgi:serine/threonine-protein kinase RsbW
MPTKTFPGRFSSLSEIAAFVIRAARKAGLDDAAVYAVELAVDEAATNIIEHAYQGEGQGEICCTFKIIPEGLQVMLQDWGIPFNPLEVPEPTIEVPLEQVQSSGLGLFFMRKLMDEVQFKFSKENGNTVTMIKKRA